MNGSGQRRNLPVGASSSSTSSLSSPVLQKTSTSLQNTSSDISLMSGGSASSSASSSSVKQISNQSLNVAKNETYQQTAMNSSPATRILSSSKDELLTPRKLSQPIKKVMSTNLSPVISESDIERTIGMVEVPDSETNKRLEAHNIINTTMDHHIYYNSTMYVNEKEVAKTWETVKKIPPSEMLSQSHRRAMVFTCVLKCCYLLKLITKMIYFYILDCSIDIRFSVLWSSGTKCDGGQWWFYLYW